RPRRIAPALETVGCGEGRDRRPWPLWIHRRHASRAARRRQAAGCAAPSGARRHQITERIVQGAGYLAIWSDLTPQDETDWSHWITREHAAERVGITGFLACRIFRALGVSVNRYFILYELEDERAVAGADYLARLNAPTPWSQRIMPRLGNFARGGGRIAASAGTGEGGIVAPLRLDAAPSCDAAKIAAELARLDRIIAVRVLLTDIAQTSIKTREKGMRSNDGSF